MIEMEDLLCKDCGKIINHDKLDDPKVKRCNTCFDKQFSICFKCENVYQECLVIPTDVTKEIYVCFFCFAKLNYCEKCHSSYDGDTCHFCKKYNYCDDCAMFLVGECLNHADSSESTDESSIILSLFDNDVILSLFDDDDDDVDFYFCLVCSRKYQSEVYDVPFYASEICPECRLKFENFCCKCSKLLCYDELAHFEGQYFCFDCAYTHEIKYCSDCDKYHYIPYHIRHCGCETQIAAYNMKENYKHSRLARRILTKKNYELMEENELLKMQIRYMPGNEGYLEAKEDFDARK